MRFGTSQSNAGGWSASTLNTFLNTRLYKAIPERIRTLIKQVKVSSSIGQKSTELAESDCYITIPACIEMDAFMTSDPYINEGTAISYMTSNEMRQRAHDGGNYDSYWLRSPNVLYTNYVYQINENGEPYGYNYPTDYAGVLIQVSI